MVFAFAGDSTITRCREGEAISWHLKALLNLDDEKAKRVTFNEITKKVVSESIKEPRAIDQDLDHAHSDGLHAARGQARTDFAPQHRGQLIAVQTVQNTTGFLGVHHGGVHITRAKAKKIGGYLGSGYTVMASVGHIRDLAQPSQVPAAEKAKYGKFGVDIEDGFKPYYIVDGNKKKTVADLKSALKKADTLYLATDEDREGEAIMRHCCRRRRALPAWR